MSKKHVNSTIVLKMGRLANSLNQCSFTFSKTVKVIGMYLSDSEACYSVNNKGKISKFV